MKLLQVASAVAVAALSASSVSATPLDAGITNYPTGVQRSIEARELERRYTKGNTAATSPLTNYQQYTYPAQLAQEAYCGQPVGSTVGDAKIL